MVMLAPPNQGSELVEHLKEFFAYRWFHGPAGQELGTSPGSLPSRLKTIAIEVGIIAGDKSYNPIFSALIPGPDNGNVSVERAKLKEMTDFLVVPSTHAFIMRNPAVMKQVVHFLEYGKFDRSQKGENVGTFFLTDEIAIPIWFFLLLLLVTSWMMLDRLLIPSARWYLRRRIDRVIEEIGSRLDIEIRPFQLTKRQVLIDRLCYDPRVIEAIKAAAQDRNVPQKMIQSEIETYAKEIVPSFNAYLYFRTGYWIAKKIARLLYWVRVGLVDNGQVAAIDPNATVVFVMNHRSNMDYILVAFLAAERTTLSLCRWRVGQDLAVTNPDQVHGCLFRAPEFQ